jgi:hypothetical protein
VKAAYPAFEPTVVGIDVLDVEDAVDDMWVMLDIERLVDNPGGSGKGGINASAVGSKRVANPVELYQREAVPGCQRCGNNSATLLAG